MDKNTPGILLDVPIGRRALDENMADVRCAINHQRPQIVFACANTHSVSVAQSNSEFLQALQSANHVVADGVGVTIMARLARVDVGPRITGEDYFRSVMRVLESLGGKRVFFFGSSETVLEKIRSRMKAGYPSIEVCGTLSPPFRAWSQKENVNMVRQINLAEPDVIWVGMTAPKQEIWASQNRCDLDAAVIGSIGAVFDYFAGTVKSPPAWVRKYGLEGIYRVFSDQNPLRFWRRAIISIPKFVFLVIWHHVLRFG